MGNTSCELGQEVCDRAMGLVANEKARASGANPNVSRLFSRVLTLGVGELREDAVSRAESCHDRYQSQSNHREQALQSLYAQMGSPRDLIGMVYCKKFFPLFKNWLASCDAHDIDVRQRLIAFTLDKEADEKTRELGVRSYFLDPDHYMEAGGSDVYGDKAFANTMFYKNAIVLELLSLGANVLFQDVDLVWRKDPFSYLNNECESEDLCIMYDGPNRIYRPLYGNTGFIYARCTNASRAVFETALGNTASIFQCRSHQLPFNGILAHFYMHNLLSLKVLPESLFLNGHLFNRVQGLSHLAADWEDEGYVVHYSWTGTIEEKMEKIQIFGLNYLSAAIGS